MALIARIATTTITLDLELDGMAPKVDVDVEVERDNPLPIELVKQLLAKALRAAADELAPLEE